jgi:hypothetical protein
MPGYLDLAREALAALSAEREHTDDEENEVNEQIPLWDEAAAAAMLTNLRAEVAAVDAAFASRTPAPLANVLADTLAIAAGYVANHEREARRGWDALALLRGTMPLVRRCVENFKQAQESQEAVL